ncbi:hypothetical protein [Falsihalocynthiibacter arcticus]
MTLHKNLLNIVAFVVTLFFLALPAAAESVLAKLLPISCRRRCRVGNWG